MQTKDQLLTRITDTGVVAVIRAGSKEQLPHIAKALVAGGIVAVEVTMTTPKALAGIEMLADLLGDAVVMGVGTVVDSATCRDAIAAGAQFVVSPTFDPEIVATTRRYGKISIPGAFTPTEILRAWTAGADIVKVFPSTALSPGYFKDILAPLPHLKLTPTGGVDLNNCGEWIKAGAVCVGVSSALISKASLAKGDWDAVTNSARAFVAAIRSGPRGNSRYPLNIVDSRGRKPRS